MNDLRVGSSRGQLKIQQMAFVLLAFILLFGFVLMFYVSIRLSSLREDVTVLRHEQAQELVRKLAASPEFAWTVNDCASCVDLDKVFALKNQSQAYRALWGTHTRLLRVQQVYPSSEREVECTRATYPDCSTITLVDQRADYSSDEAYVALCRMEGTSVGSRCVLGKLILGVASA